MLPVSLVLYRDNRFLTIHGKDAVCFFADFERATLQHRVLGIVEREHDHRFNICDLSAS